MEYQVFVFNLVFLVIWQCIAKGTSGLIIYQSPSVTGREGDTVIMNCTLSNESVGPFRWYKGENQQQLLYSQLTSPKSDSQLTSEISDPRVSRTVKEGPTRDTDFSITFTNISWDDAGMYYCVKFKSDKKTVAASGNGTQLYVTPKPSPPYFPPSLSGPIQQVRLNKLLTFNCTSAGFYPPEIHVTWWQNDKEPPGAKSDVCSNDGNRTYQVKSTITIPAKIDSPVTCRINHSELNQPIHSTFNISNIVNEPSTPLVSGPDGQVLSNANVTIYCKSVGFYPKEISVIWEQDGNVLQGSKLDITLNSADRTYQALSNVTVPAKIDSNVTCRINHTALDQPEQSIFKLKVNVKETSSSANISSAKIAMIAGIACGILGVLLITTIIFLHLQKRKKEKTASQKRLNTSNSAAKQKQEQNDDVITYASLNLRGGDSQPRSTAHEEVIEYGQVKFKGGPDNEVTYADVSIAKPRKKKGASTKQASVPQYFVQESGTEYAAVNIRSKAKK